MPELIDLEVSKENILRKVEGEKLTKIKFLEKSVLRNTKVDAVRSALEGEKLGDITRRAKILQFHFGKKFLIVHLMLHGDFCWESEGKEEKNVVCSMAYSSGPVILIKDWSRWTKIELHDPENGIDAEMLDTEYGPDPLSEEFTEEVLRVILERKRRSGLKKVLTEQSEIAGIGNAYADEILWEAKLHPAVRCGAVVDKNEVDRLWKAVNEELLDSLDRVRELSGGEEISEQVRDFMRIYRKSGQKCPRCGYMIACLKMNGRDTFVCEKCQEKL